MLSLDFEIGNNELEVLKIRRNAKQACENPESNSREGELVF